jgi:hypothetical protein
MFDKYIVRKAIRQSLTPDFNAGWQYYSHTDNQDGLVSLLIHDIFGGEILKTHKRKGWHFYNRINGERIDLVRSEFNKSPGRKSFEDLPSTPEETLDYVPQEDYSTFFVRFIGAFEESVGLNNYEANNMMPAE